MAPTPRVPGVSSRITKKRGDRHPWTTRGVTIDLPVVVDWVFTEESTGDVRVRIEATVDLIGDAPAIVQMAFDSPVGLDISHLQREFRWATPLDVVTALIPKLIAEGLDPFAEEIPVTGFPAVAVQPTRRRQGSLSDEFLETIAREYLRRGRGYATSLADEYFVSPRTVISWVEKARARGMLSAPPRRGAVGGHLIDAPSTATRKH